MTKTNKIIAMVLPLAFALIVAGSYVMSGEPEKECNFIPGTNLNAKNFEYKIKIIDSSHYSASPFGENIILYGVYAKNSDDRYSYHEYTLEESKLCKEIIEPAPSVEADTKAD